MICPIVQKLAHAVVYALFLAFATPTAFASAESLARAPIEGAVYYDAENVTADEKEGSISLQGSVLFLFGNNFVKCDVLRYYRNSGIVAAEGNVIVYREKQRIYASRMVAHISSKEFYTENVKITVDPSADTNEINEKVLGFTKAELQFETLKAARQSDLIAELGNLRERYVSLKNLRSVKRTTEEIKELELKIEETERRYAQILGRLARTRYQPNLFLESLPTAEQEKLAQRRQTVSEFLNSNKQRASQIAALDSFPGYLGLTAATVHQRADGKIEAKGARLTPCKCGLDEVPIWGLSSADALLETGRYATLYGATADVASFPALYVPYLKFPIKTERESGFLLPSIFVTRAGQIVSIPYFQTLGDHADTTVTVEEFSGRGNRFGAELRAAASSSAKATLAAEYINDAKRVRDFDPARKEAEIKEKYEGDEYRIQKLKSQIGTVSNERWKTTGALNLPFYSMAAAKADWTVVSDNQYLSDFSVDQESKSDLFAPAQSSFRFLTQEAAAEYYGDRFGLSVRLQKFKDVLEPDSDETPYRNPKIEFSLFPFRILNTIISFDQTLTWEKISRENRTIFIDGFEQQSIVNSAGEPEVITGLPDGKRTPNEPFITGQRIYGQSVFGLPLTSNRYFVSNILLRGNTSAYLFDATEPFPRQTSRMSYVAYELNNASSIELKKYFGTKSSSSNLFALNVVKPFFNFVFVPQVNRDPNFPNFYDVFYEADNFAPARTAYFGFNSDIIFGRKSFAQVQIPLKRFASQDVSEPAESKNFLQAISETLDPMANEKTLDQENVFKLSTTIEFSETLKTWAKIELGKYEKEVLRREFGQHLQWPEPPYFRNAEETIANPLKFGLSTSYNFDAETTRNDIQSRLRPGTFADRIDPWGDVVLYANAAGSPWLPVSAGVSVSWSPWRKSFYTGTTSASVSLPFDLGLNVFNTFENYFVQTGTSEANKLRYLKRSIGFGVTYTPLKWLAFSYQRKSDSDSQFINSLPEPELRYEALQKMSFLNLQDCLDIEITRYKKKEVVERNATWTIGLNLKFLGQAKSFADVGASVNRSIQNRNVEF